MALSLLLAKSSPQTDKNSIIYHKLMTFLLIPCFILLLINPWMNSSKIIYPSNAQRDRSITQIYQWRMTYTNIYNFIQNSTGILATFYNTLSKISRIGLYTLLTLLLTIIYETNWNSFLIVRCNETLLLTK